MKKDIHPQYRPVVFLDVASDYKILTRSTIKSHETIQFEGQEYPLVKLEISSASHPFFTGQERLVDALGRVERFQKKFGGEYFKKPAEPKKAKTPTRR